MKIGLPNGKIVETPLEKWQISYIFYMAFNSGISNSKPIELLMNLPPDDSFFSSVVARTWKSGWDSREEIIDAAK